MRGERPPTVALIATLDTKGPEIAFIRDRLAELGVASLIIDSGIINTPTVTADITRENVAREAGRELSDMQNAGSRGAAVELMQEALAALGARLHREGAIDAALSIGGAEGAQLGAAFMHVLPVGVPKLIVSPSASGRRQFYPFIGSSDVMVMHSVIDILGINAVSRSVFNNAAAAIAGMCSWGSERPTSERPSVGITMLGQTTPGAEMLARRLESSGYEPVMFHANGVGGPAMDAMARDGVLAGVIEFTLSELANTLFDGIHATGPDRIRGAVEAGIPLVVAPGAADFFNEGPLDTLPDRYRNRLHYKHNPVATLVRVDAGEMRALARQLAERLDPATAPVTVVVPTRGLSLVGVPGGPIADETADLAFLDELRKSLRPDIPLIEVADHINSAAVADVVADALLASLAAAGSGGDVAHREPA